MASIVRVLFLHGLEGSPNGTKARVLIGAGCAVTAPALPRDDFATSVRLAQEAFDAHQPHVVVGSSRGGAVALSLHTGPRPVRMVLCCPAWRRFAPGAAPAADTWILHAPADEIVPYEDSAALVERSGLPPAHLIAVGNDHRLHDPVAWQLMLRLVQEAPGQ